MNLKQCGNEVGGGSGKVYLCPCLEGGAEHNGYI